MSETTLQKKDGGTESVPGWWVKFAASVLEQLPRPGQITRELAIHLTRNQEGLKYALHQSLAEGPPRYPGMWVGPLKLVYVTTRIEPDKVKNICDAGEVFPAGIGRQFKSYSNAEIVPRPSAFLDVYEVAGNFVLRDFLPFLTDNLENLAIPQEHIIGLCRSNPGLLRAGTGGNYFFIQTKLGVHLIRVFKKSGDLQVVDEGQDFMMWSLEKKNSPRFFVASPLSAT